MPTGVYVRTEETKKILSKAKSGKNHSFYGKHLSEEHKRKIGKGNKIAIKKWWDGIPKEERKRSEETKIKMSIAGLKKWAKFSKEERKEKSKNWIKAGVIAAQKVNPSSIEKMIWKVLDSLNIKYETQVPFCYGRFVVDIHIPDKDLIIECNGNYWHSLPDRIKRDNTLQKYCDKWGIKLAWIWENDIRENPRLALRNSLRKIIGGRK